MRRFLIAGIAVLLSGCGGSNTPPPTTLPTTTTVLIGRACADFSTLLTDQGKGILTDDELRERIKSIYAESAGDSPAIRKAAEDLLAADTDGNVASVKLGEDELSNACIADYSAKSAS